MASNSTPHVMLGKDSSPANASTLPQKLEQSGLTTTQGLSQNQTATTEQDAAGEAPKKPKSEKELAKERVKQEKAAKFAEKQAKAQSNSESTSSKKKEKSKEEAEVIPAYEEKTPKGEKKILDSLDDIHHKAYIPSVVESAWNDWWEKEGFFKPEYTKDGEVKPKGSFVVTIPPPNVTGALHIGHAIATTLQDTMVRWHRMRGYTTLYIPGCDHAGIATQVVVEKMLARRQNKSRHDLGRTKFVETVHEWKEEYHQKINKTLRRLGGSLDWSREAFTMDTTFSAAVTELFVRLHEEGSIYRANKIVNWCPALCTALSNIEVDSKEIPGRTLLDVPGYTRKVEFGVLTHFKYPVEGSDETIEVATTRPETMLGDTGIAVHPKDERYKHLVGKKAKHPFVERSIPIFADEHVDPEFGTGAVKITPAHDPNDFNLGKKHNLEFINILNDDGTLNEQGGPFCGQKRFDVRYKVVEELTKLGLFVTKTDNPMTLPICSRSKDVIETVVKPQWWMRMEDMAKDAVDVVVDGQIQIRPEMHKRKYLAWMKDVHDWCLSRQLWWGHQIPAYYITIEGQNSEDEDDKYWFTGRSVEEARKKAELKFPNTKFTMRRDEDCLDTWFSAGLWPFATLGWPNPIQDYDKLYPTTMLETGWDILFFWVARMIMLGRKLTGKIPFSEVYCHGLIRDADGRKMSKSLGNVVDPVDIMNGISLDELHAKLKTGNLDPKEVAQATAWQKKAFPQGIIECGADALRFSLLQYTTSSGGDIAFDVKVMQGYRRFCNKIYQATKYVLGNLPANYLPPKTSQSLGKESLAEKWILHKMNEVTKEINEALTQREYSLSSAKLYKYWLYDLCDVYIENSKTIIRDGNEEEKMSAVNTLYTALESGLLLMHPFMPFLTEELWQRLPRREGDSTKSIVIAEYPEYNSSLEDQTSADAYELVIDSSKGIRSLLSEYSIKEDGQAFIYTTDATAFKTVSDNQSSIRTLAGRVCSSIKMLGPSDSAPSGCAVYAVSAATAIYVSIAGRVDLDAEIEKVKNKLQKASLNVDKQKKLLATEGFADKASYQILEAEKDKLRDSEAEVRNFERSVEQFERLKLEDGNK